MKYKGLELKEFTSDKPVVFDPPKKMVVWDYEEDDDDDDEPNTTIDEVVCFIPGRYAQVVTMGGFYSDCAELPKTKKARRATNLELSKWLAHGNGQWRDAVSFVRRTDFFYTDDTNAVRDILVRKWDDSEWHEPTTDYMGLED